MVIHFLSLEKGLAQSALCPATSDMLSLGLNKCLCHHWEGHVPGVGYAVLRMYYTETQVQAFFEERLFNFHGTSAVSPPSLLFLSSIFRELLFLSKDLQGISLVQKAP